MTAERVRSRSASNPITPPEGNLPERTRNPNVPEERFGYFALALTLAASALTAEAWSPPYQTHRLYYSNQYGLRSPTSMSLDNSDAFTIRITGLQMDWNFRDYGNVFRMVHEQVAGRLTSTS